ncbi:hypothetical protein QZH41_002956 [Actinostola sp. cb2023]|nr:hypothetical protein QZH41_002956 [Actinostola sp. cb2023]
MLDMRTLVARTLFDKEITTLSTDEVMTLHFVKKCRMLKGLSELELNEKLSIPMNTQGTIELLSDKLPKVYKSVKAVKNDSAKMVLSMHSHAWLGIQEKDVLKIEGSKRKRGKEFLRCSLVNRKGDDVELPISYEACFQSYEEPKRIDIICVESHCNFPCTVKIHGHSMTKDNVDERSQSLDLSTLGRIKLLGAYDYVKVIASIRHMGKVLVMQVPIDLEITVAAAKGAQQKESSYQSLCKEIHDNTQFQQLDGIDQLDYVKMGNDEDSVDNIYEYIDLRYLKLPPSPERTTSTKPPTSPKPRTTSLRTTSTKPQISPKPRTKSMESERHHRCTHPAHRQPIHKQTD